MMHKSLIQATPDDLALRYHCMNMVASIIVMAQLRAAFNFDLYAAFLKRMGVKRV